MVQLDRQAPLRGDAAGGLYASRGQPRRGRGGSCLGRTLREGRGRKSAAPERGIADRTVSAATNPTALYSQTGKPGDASPGDTNGTRPGGTDGASYGDGTDLRAGLRCAQLRLSPRTGLQGRAAAGDGTARGRLRPHRGCRSEELLRHHSEGSPEGPGGPEGDGRPHPGADRELPRTGGSGRRGG